jgi:hypothetical protein
MIMASDKRCRASSEQRQVLDTGGAPGAGGYPTGRRLGGLSRGLSANAAWG